MFEEDDRKKPPAHQLGGTLEPLSVDELERLKAILAEELRRVEAEIARKRATAAAAEAFFRKGS